MRTPAELHNAALAVAAVKKIEVINSESTEPTEDYRMLCVIEQTLLWALGQDDSPVAEICNAGATAAKDAGKRHAERN